MPMNARIDSDDLHNLLAHQPMDYKLEPLEAVVDYAADGTPIITKRPSVAGLPLEWTWGNVVDPATVQELKAARNGLVTHQVYFNDKGGDPHAYNVFWLADPTIEAGPGAAYRPLTVRFLVLSEIAAS